MKIAVPVKTNRENPAVAPLFGKAKWFAFIDEDNIEIKENSVKNGAGVVKMFLNEGVDVVLFQEMGVSPYKMIKENGIKLYHVGYDRILLEDALNKLKSGKLIQMDDDNIEDIIKHHEKKHTH